MQKKIKKIKLSLNCLSQKWGQVHLGLSVRIHVCLLFEASGERARSLKSHVEIINTEQQQEAVAGCPVIGAQQ